MMNESQTNRNNASIKQCHLIAGVVFSFCSLLSLSSYAAVTIDYTYDNLNRLKTVTRDDGQKNNYGYDAKGNIIVTNGQDSDGDGLYDAEEIYHGTSSGNPDTDGDGLRDGDEITLHGTNPNNPDHDGDGLLDGFEVQYGFNPLVDEGAAGLDPDGDGLTNLQEQSYGTNPHDTDSDNDGVDDNDEIAQGRNPAVNEAAIMAIITMLLLDDCVDTDGDGLDDCFEQQIGTNPNLTDSDTDGLTDYEEVNYDGNPASYNPYHSVTNPAGTDLDANESDTDGDGYSDQAEITAGADPLNPADVPSAAADGDMNNDGVVNAADVLIATRIISGQLTITAEQMSHGDVAPLVNGQPSPDGQFNTGDLVVIQRKVLGLVNF